MRFLKLANAKNPDNDYILLNGGFFDKDGNTVSNFVAFNGLLCTGFKNLGISRNLEFSSIKSRQFVVDEKFAFKKYELTIDFFSTYQEYESKYRQLIDFIDRNKKDGFRLYFRPHNEKGIKNCLCCVEMLSKNENRNPVTLSLVQCSLWFGEEKTAETSANEKAQEGTFCFSNSDKDGYYSAKFAKDDSISVVNGVGYYCIKFNNGAGTRADIDVLGYNEIPLKIEIMGRCVNPEILLYRLGEKTPFRKTKIFVTIEKGEYLEINARVLEEKVELVTKDGRRIDYSTNVDNSYGSPYFYVDNGKYVLEVIEESGSCDAIVRYQEEYNE